MDDDRGGFLTGDMPRQVATSPDDEPYVVLVPEASEMFAAAGLPRTERAIQRFCKKGELKWALVDTPYGSKYAITRSSIERLIIQKQQAQKFAPTDQSRPVATGPDLSRQEHDVTPTENLHEPGERYPTKDRGHDTSRDDDRRQEATEDVAKDQTIEKLQSQIFDLKVDNAGKQSFIRQLAAEREKWMNDTRDLSYRLGAAESRLGQLEAPKQHSDDVSRHVATSSDKEIVDPTPVGEGIEVSRAVANQPSPAPDASEPKKSFWRRTFGS